MKNPVIMAFATTLLACGPNEQSPGTYLQEPGSANSYEDVGPLGVAHHDLWISARHTDVIRTDVYYPSTSDGVMDSTLAPYPVIVLIQEQYRGPKNFQWLATHLASWGMVVAVPKHPWNNPAWNIDNAVWTLDGILSLNQQGDSFLGQNLSSTDAGLIRFFIDSDVTSEIDEYDRFDTISLVGSNMDPSSTFQASATLLFVMGGNDCREPEVDNWDSYNTLRHQVTVIGQSESQLNGQDVAEETATPTSCPAGQSCTQQICSPEITESQARSYTAGAIAAFEWTYLRTATDTDSLTESYQGNENLTTVITALKTEE